MTDTLQVNVPQLQQPSPKLAKWQHDILCTWYAQYHRVASNMELLCFFVLLRAPETEIQAKLSRLLKTGHSKSMNSESLHVEGYQAEPYPHVPPDDTVNNNTGCDQEPSRDYNLSQLGGQLTGIDHLRLMLHNTSHSKQDAGPATGYNRMPLGSGIPPYAQHGNMPFPHATAQQGAPYGSNDAFRSFDNNFSTSAEPFLAQGATTEAVRKLVQGAVHVKATRGCHPLRGHEVQKGSYPCSLGCERRFRTSNDLFRHEETVYPQQFWFCSLCGDPEDPLDKYLFTREDKIRQHMKAFHPYDFGFARFRVSNIRTTYPKKCELCLNFRFRSWKERRNHIISHCKRGEDVSRARKRSRTRRSTRETGVVLGDDEDDDNDGNDDDEDRDDESGENDQDAGPRPRTDKDSGGDYDDPSQPGRDELTQGFSDICRWNSPDIWKLADHGLPYPLLVSSCAGKRQILVDLEVPSTKASPEKCREKCVQPQKQQTLKRREMFFFLCHDLINDVARGGALIQIVCSIVKQCHNPSDQECHPARHRRSPTLVARPSHLVDRHPQSPMSMASGRSEAIEVLDMSWNIDFHDYGQLSHKVRPVQELISCDGGYQSSTAEVQDPRFYFILTIMILNYRLVERWLSGCCKGRQDSSYFRLDVHRLRHLHHFLMEHCDSENGDSDGLEHTRAT